MGSPVSLQQLDAARSDPGEMFHTVETAAQILKLSVKALRERLRRAQRRVGKEIVADLGIATGRKFGRSWRITVRAAPA